MNHDIGGHWLGGIHGDGVESRKRHVDMRHGAIDAIFRPRGRDRRSDCHCGGLCYSPVGGEQHKQREGD